VVCTVLPVAEKSAWRWSQLGVAELAGVRVFALCGARV
jgi:hypothetical protein